MGKHNVVVMLKIDGFIQEAVKTFKDVEDADVERLRELVGRVRID